MSEGEAMTIGAFEVPHPGEYLRDELEARGWNQLDLAFVMKISETHVNKIIAGKMGITPDMARRLGDAMQVSPDFWNNLQKAYDASRAPASDEDVAHIGRLQTAFPLRLMIKRGWIREGDPGQIDSQLATFFEGKAVEDIPRLPMAAKRTAYDDVPPAQHVWLYRVRQIARTMVVLAPYSERSLRKTLAEMAAWRLSPESIEKVAPALAACGVRFVAVEKLPGALIDGVCTWLDDSTPVIGMSLRFDRIDNFWFVLRHEIEHVLLGHGKTVAIIDAELEGEKASASSAAISEEERLANQAAAEFCVPKKEMDDFMRRRSPFFSELDLIGFSRRIRVHPGLVAGRLQHETGKHERFRKHQVSVRAHVIATATYDGWDRPFPVPA